MERDVILGALWQPRAPPIVRCGTELGCIVASSDCLALRASEKPISYCETPARGRHTRDRGGGTHHPGLLRTALLQGETTSSLICRVAPVQVGFGVLRKPFAQRDLSGLGRIGAVKAPRLTGA